MSEFTLRYTGEDTAADWLPPIDRRSAIRRRLTNTVTAMVSGNASDAPRLMPVETLNISESGIGVISEVPLMRGAEVRLFFSPHGGDPGFELRGWVARCEPREARYHIGLSFGRRGTAAA